MLSHESKYALKALLVLSEEYGEGPLLISEIAEREHIPERFLELILLELKNQGVLRSKKGKEWWLHPQQAARSCVSWTCSANARGSPGFAAMPEQDRPYEKCLECRDERTCGIRLLMKR